MSSSVDFEVARLDNPILPYAWGSRHFLARLQGRPSPTPEPEAELWVGAHPRAPSSLAGHPDVTLLDVIAANPFAQLGVESVDRFGPALPFLAKLLAAARPLSVQVHPDAERARKGFESEEANGVPLGAQHRRYADPNRKVEMLIALEPTSALCGFRTSTSARGALGRISGPVIARLCEAIPEEDDRFAARVFLAARQLTSSDRKQMASELARYARAEAESTLEAHWVGVVTKHYKADPGCLAPLLLNIVNLEPTDGLYISPGTVHAYLQGAGLEVMSSSDNVLRGGLTPKFVDEKEFGRVADFRPREATIIRPRATESGQRIYRIESDDVGEFVIREHVLTQTQPSTDSARRHSAAVMICTRGIARIKTTHAAAPTASIELGAGEALWIPAHANGPIQSCLAAKRTESTVYEISALGD